MATRVSPRSNASSASSSSASSSRRAYRNPSFGKDRDSVNSDPWVSDGRIAHAAKQPQQHNRGQWSQKSHQTRKGWDNSSTPIAEENESRLSWRSQKQAVDSFSSYLDSGQAIGTQQLDRTHGASPLPSALHTSRSQWNCAKPGEQNFYGQQSRPALNSQQPAWERHQPNFTKQNQYVSDRVTRRNSNPASSNFNHNQGYLSSHSNYGSPVSNLNHNSGLRGTTASFQREFRNDPVNAYGESGGHTGKYGQGFRNSAGSSIPAIGVGTEVQRAPVAQRNWEGRSALNTQGRGEKYFDNFPPLTIRDETGQSNIEVTSTPRSALDRAWGEISAITGSWADECNDDPPQAYNMGAKTVGNTHKSDWVNSDLVTMRRSNANSISHSGPHASVANRDGWRQNSQQGSNVSVVAGISTHSLNTNNENKHSFSVKQGESTRNTSYVQLQRRSKHSVATASDQRVGKGGDTGVDKFVSLKEAGFGGNNGEEPVTPKNQVSPSQAGVDASDDVMLPFIMGTCEDMCPLKERKQRERLRDLAVFERVNRNPSKTSRELAVKKFCRTFTGVELVSDDVRPLRILWSTLQYLLNLLDDSEFSFDVVHNFLFDRTRAIRQELGMQRIANRQAINMYEEIVRFHILSEHELNQRGSGRHVSDSHLNLQQLSKSLLSLFDLYQLNGKDKLANEAEFRAYYVLLNLGSSSIHQADSLAVWFRQCPAALFKSWELKFARTVLRFYRSGNYKAFFQLVQEATFLQSCLLELHFNEMRLQSLAAANQGGYKLHPIPLADIAKELLMKEGDLEELCNLCGLSAGMDASRVRCLFVKQAQFSAPKELPSYRCPCIVNKRPASYYKEVTGLRQRLI